ncbi:MAG: class I SAM-dependent methyltransferase [Alphaproteobacteria bacterium]
MVERRGNRATGPETQMPVLLETSGFDDYALLDSGDGEKLERYGPYHIVRPEPQAMWRRRLPVARWDEAHAVFTGGKDEESDGRWRFREELPETWKMQFDGVRFEGRFTGFRHLGVFPEQAAHWLWLRDLIKGANRPTRVLNLFGYTGIASLIAANAGAAVTHLDGSKKAIAWARENQKASRMDDLPIRWICDDAMKFVRREERRNSRYDAIILDPPKFGRGPKGEVWDLFVDLAEMVRICRTLLSDDPLLLVLTAYSIRASFASIHELTNESLAGLPGTLESGELLLREAGGGRVLSTSLYSRWHV